VAQESAYLIASFKPLNPSALVSWDLANTDICGGDPNAMPELRKAPPSDLNLALQVGLAFIAMRRMLLCKSSVCPGPSSLANYTAPSQVTLQVTSHLLRAGKHTKAPPLQCALPDPTCVPHVPCM
jgi:hypothetical protein